MKKITKNFFLALALLVFSVLDSYFFSRFRFSLLLCICFSFYNHKACAVVISGLTGLLCDIVSLTLPYFSLLYLYISLGCVWCEGIFLKLKLRTVFLLSFIAFFIFYLSTQTINMMAYSCLFVDFNFLISSVIFSLTNSILAPAVYFCFKRFKF